MDNNIRFGKCVKDIPFDKIYPGMRVALDEGGIHLGRVLKTKTTKWHHSIPSKFDIILIELDVYGFHSIFHNIARNLFYIEE